MPKEKTLELKKAKVQEVSEKMKSAKLYVFVDYRGLTVEQDTALRKAMREADIDYKVIKNSIVEFAAKENGVEGLEDFLIGPTSIAISETDPVAPSKLAAKFNKDFEAFKIKGGVVEGKVVDIEEIKAIASLPSREELVAKVLGALNGPIYGLASVLNGTIRGLAAALNAVAEKKQDAS